MIGSELGYNAGQFGNDWEDNIWVAYNPLGINHVSIYNDRDDKFFSYGEPVPYAKEVYKELRMNRHISFLGNAENDVLQVSPLNSYLKSYKLNNRDVAMYRLELTEKDRKIVENNLINSTKGLYEFKCIGNNCAQGKIKTAREGGKYYLNINTPYSLTNNNCTTYVKNQFINTSKELEIFFHVDTLPSQLRNYAINYTSIGGINELKKVTNSSLLKYYHYNGNKSETTYDLTGKNAYEIKKKLEEWEKGK